MNQLSPVKTLQHSRVSTTRLHDPVCHLLSKPWPTLNSSLWEEKHILDIWHTHVTLKCGMFLFYLANLALYLPQQWTVSDLINVLENRSDRPYLFLK